MLSPKVILLGATLMLAGCAHYEWMKPAGDPSTFGVDSYNCKQSSMGTAPPVFQTYGAMPLPRPPVHTRCFNDGYREVCKTVVEGGPYVPPPRTVDLNAANREDMYQACMGAQGWVYQRVDE